MAGEEYEHIEYKQSLAEIKAIVESVAAFATVKGGTIRIGFKPDGTRIGTQLGRGSLEQLANEIKQSTQPVQFPSIQIEGPENSATIEIHVAESPAKPVWAYNIPYQRVGRTNQKLTSEATRILMEASSGRTWDALTCREFTKEDADREAVRTFLRNAKEDTATTTGRVLTNLNLGTLDGLSNAGALLFARNPQRFFPSALVKCARFDGVSSVRFLDQQTLDGSVISQIEAALAFVERNTRQSIVITGHTAQRETVPEYPLEAVREAVSNAVCHRDYTDTANVQIRIYDDRLEIWNPGMLPPDLTVEDLYHEHPSKPRNLKLATALYRARVIEQWGTGTLRIVKACEAVGLPRPEFVSEMGVFKVRFPKTLLGLSPNITLNVNNRIYTFKDLLLLLNDRQVKALTFVYQNTRITTRQYQEMFGISERQAQLDLADLSKLRVLVRKGSKRGPGSHFILFTDAAESANLSESVTGEANQDRVE